MTNKNELTKLLLIDYFNNPNIFFFKEDEKTLTYIVKVDGFLSHNGFVECEPCGEVFLITFNKSDYEEFKKYLQLFD
jgi:hypothetical protein